VTFPTAHTFIVIIESIGIPTNDVAEVWLEDPVNPLAGKMLHGSDKRFAARWLLCRS